MRSLLGWVPWVSWGDLGRRPPRPRTARSGSDTLRPEGARGRRYVSPAGWRDVEPDHDGLRDRCVGLVGDVVERYEHVGLGVVRRGAAHRRRIAHGAQTGQPPFAVRGDRDEVDGVTVGDAQGPQVLGVDEDDVASVLDAPVAVVV